MAEQSQAHVVGTITYRKDHGPDLWSVRVRPQAPIPFKPGQYVSLGVREGERIIERPYSMVSAPHEPELEFFFELVPHGELTPRLHRLRTGDSLLLRRRAKGMFTLDARSGHRQHFMVSTVTGVAPCLSILRDLDRQAAEGRAQQGQIVLLQGASRSWELGYHQELQALAQRHEHWLRYVPTISRPWEDLEWPGEVGRCEDLIRKHLDGAEFEPRTATAYLCGHPGMIDNGKGILLRRGFDRDDLHVEVYWVPPKHPGRAEAAAP